MSTYMEKLKHKAQLLSLLALKLNNGVTHTEMSI